MGFPQEMFIHVPPGQRPDSSHTGAYPFRSTHPGFHPAPRPPGKEGASSWDSSNLVEHELAGFMMRRAVLLLGAVAVMAADVARTNETLHLAYCSYCSEESLASWSCRWCNDTRADIDLVKYMNDDTNGTRGFVGVDAENERVVVSFRGSYNNPNTLEDAAFWLHQLEGAPEGVLVHRGFDYAWSTLANDTRAAIDLALERCEGCTVLFTGARLLLPSGTT